MTAPGEARSPAYYNSKQKPWLVHCLGGRRFESQLTASSANRCWEKTHKRTNCVFLPVMPRKLSDQKLWRSKAVFTLLIPIVLYPNILLNKLQIENFFFSSRISSSQIDFWPPKIQRVESGGCVWIFYRRIPKKRRRKSSRFSVKVRIVRKRRHHIVSGIF